MSEQTYPEGFDATCGLPAWAMQMANATAASLTGKREWDVPCIAAAIEAAVLARVAPKEPVAYCNVEMWKSGGKHWPDDCFSETPIEGYAPLYAAPSHQEGAKLQTD
jgi:hypothetical protein